MGATGFASTRGDYSFADGLGLAKELPTVPVGAVDIVSPAVIAKGYGGGTSIGAPVGSEPSPLPSFSSHSVQ